MNDDAQIINLGRTIDRDAGTYNAPISLWRHFATEKSPRAMGAFSFAPKINDGLGSLEEELRFG